MWKRKLNSIKNKNMSRVERQRLQSDIWGAYWSQCYIPLSFFLEELKQRFRCGGECFVSLWEGLHHSGSSGQGFFHALLKLSFPVSLTMTDSSMFTHINDFVRRARFISGCCTDANSLRVYSRLKAHQRGRSTSAFSAFHDAYTHKHAHFAPFLQSQDTLITG